MLQLTGVEFSYNQLIEIDFDGRGRWRVSRPTDLWNPLGIVSTTGHSNWIYFPIVVASAIYCHQFMMISPSKVMCNVTGRLAFGIYTKSPLLLFTSIPQIYQVTYLMS
jgi:hypothetical protein